jgi:hypothetical protein
MYIFIIDIVKKNNVLHRFVFFTDFPVSSTILLPNLAMSNMAGWETETVYYSRAPRLILGFWWVRCAHLFYILCTLFSLSSFYVLCPMLCVSLDYPLSIALSISLTFIQSTRWEHEVQSTMNPSVIGTLWKCSNGVLYLILHFTHRTIHTHEV